MIILCVVLGTALVMAAMRVSDRFMIQRYSVFLGRGTELQPVVNAPAWALEELKFIRAAERLTQVDAVDVSHSCVADLLVKRSAKTA
jgi:hypothetical protein